jgi:hypothetical protein
MQNNKHRIDLFNAKTGFYLPYFNKSNKKFREIRNGECIIISLKDQKLKIMIKDSQG